MMIEISKNILVILIAAGFSNVVYAQSAPGLLGDCQKAVTLDTSDRELSPEIFENLNDSMTAEEIVDVLGLPARDVGSGLYVLQWDVIDGRVFSISVSNLCSKPLNSGFR